MTTHISSAGHLSAVTATRSGRSTATNDTAEFAELLSKVKAAKSKTSFVENGLETAVGRETSNTKTAKSYTGLLSGKI